MPYDPAANPMWMIAIRITSGLLIAAPNEERCFCLFSASRREMSQARSSPVSQRASDGRSVKQNQTTTPKIIAGAPSRIKSHYQLESVQKFPICNSAPEIGEPTNADSGIAVMNSAVNFPLYSGGNQ